MFSRETAGKIAQKAGTQLLPLEYHEAQQKPADRRSAKVRESAQIRTPSLRFARRPIRWSSPF
jgi:hypothetical protein